MDSRLAMQLNAWLEMDPDPQTREELQQLMQQRDDQELVKRFAGRLAFGTAGLRGEVGAGPTRMNQLVIRQTAAGLGQYLLQQLPDAKSRGVIIGYDGRLDSARFATDTAAVLTAQGITVRITRRVCPTPLVAYGVKHFGAAAGVVVTASHNPPQYNGFKVYWGNGAQIIPPHDAGIAACITAAAIHKVPVKSLVDAEEEGLLQWLGDAFYLSYRKAVGAMPLLQASTRKKDMGIAYTAMHGVGAEMAKVLLADAGFTRVYSVAAQEQPDGHFPTVNFPNPEEAGAMDLVIAEASKYQALLACANDPDADRFAVAVRRGDNYQMLSGDQVGALLGHYLLQKAPAHQRLVGTTIVSSALLSQIAKAAGGECYTTLTGFKWLANVGMKQQSDKQQFLFAYEEALGYTVGNLVWDKDGLSALLAFVQMTAEVIAAGKSLWQQLEAIYREHGIYLNRQVSIALKPDTPDIGGGLRQNPPQTIAGMKVLSVADLKTHQQVFADGHVEVINLPASDVLIYHLENGGRVVVRPSGTEPKIKCYYQLVEPLLPQDNLEAAESRGNLRMDVLIKQHQASLPQ
ncbi:phospho-sugar mutase [Shewanella yunxiaonensis]|uniref:Phospho-sugar mutase n=1 Tax=Shewanella yunxiaonensis TaxID=2829809 RepID=A0ABX7YWR4_9GAMM|nr:phospho-sugar mutase [Shewanella yunxiaonensis]QUN07117.1 phospho-sugar mutase [Shewanella yunxiaonensis]